VNSRVRRAAVSYSEIVTGEGYRDVHRTTASLVAAARVSAPFVG
jgi:hypothetical protein